MEPLESLSHPFSLGTPTATVGVVEELSGGIHRISRNICASHNICGPFEDRAVVP